MPRQRITKEMVVEAAFSLAREGGMEKVLVKNIAERIGCSVQPVYCYCRNMDGLRADVVEYTGKFIQEYVSERIDSSCLFESVGRAHALLAKEEPHLYRLYFLRKRKRAHSLEEIYQEETNPKVLEDITQKLGMEEDRAKRLHKHMVIYDIGLSFILACLGEETNTEEMKIMANEAYEAFQAKFMEMEAAKR